MISVRYFTMAEPYNLRGPQGWDFVDEHDTISRFIENHTETINWRGFAEWCARENPSITKVWVNSILVWTRHDGWLVDIKNFCP